MWNAYSFDVFTFLSAITYNKRREIQGSWNLVV